LSAMEFSKYEATANDFIMLDRTTGGPLTSVDQAVSLCARRTGVGADGVIEALPSDACDLRMRILNADGSEAEMCGNGARALLLFALDRGISTANEITVETPAGVRRVRVAGEGPSGRLFSVEMGEPVWSRGEIPVEGPAGDEAIDVEVPIGSSVLRATCVSMGNPHCVVFVDDVASFPVESTGREIECHPMFPEKTNVEFARVDAADRVGARVWERGVGETMACGTGACAILVAASLKGLTGRSATVSLPGGLLEVEWREGQVVLTGPARHVFDGKTVG